MNISDSFSLFTWAADFEPLKKPKWLPGKAAAIKLKKYKGIWAS